MKNIKIKMLLAALLLMLLLSANALAAANGIGLGEYGYASTGYYVYNPESGEYDFASTEPAGGYVYYDAKNNVVRMHNAAIYGKNGVTFSISGDAATIILEGQNMIYMSEDTSFESYIETGMSLQTDTTITGSGDLTIKSDGKNTKVSMDSIGIVADGSLTIDMTGRLEVTASDGDSSSTAIRMAEPGGNLHIKNGDIELAYGNSGHNGAAAIVINSEHDFIMDGGRVVCKDNGKTGAVKHGLRSQGNMIVNDGTIIVEVGDGEFINGIQVNKELTVNGGDIQLQMGAGRAVQTLSADKMVMRDCKVDVKCADANPAYVDYRTRCYGIWSNGDITVDNSVINVQSGDDYNQSLGLYGSTLTITGGSKVTSIAGEASDRSESIFSDNLTVSDNSVVKAYVTMNQYDESFNSIIIAYGTMNVNTGSSVFAGVIGDSQKVNVEGLYANHIVTDSTGTIVAINVAEGSGTGIDSTAVQNMLLFGQDSTVKGNITLAEQVVIPEGVTVVVPADAKLNFTGSGALVLEKGSTLVIEDKNSVQSGKIKGAGQIIIGNQPAADTPAANDPATNDPAQGGIDVPKTGDEATPMLWAMLLALTGAALIALRRSARSHG